MTSSATGTATSSPGSAPEWLDVAGRASTRVLVTPEEAHALEEAVEALLAPYVLRKDDPASAPEGAATVHLLRHTLPDGPRRAPVAPTTGRAWLSAPRPPPPRPTDRCGASGTSRPTGPARASRSSATG